MLPHEIEEEIRKAGGAIQPSVSDVHVNRPLTNISVAYTQMASAFVADRVFPGIGVLKKSDMFWTYDRNSYLRSQMQERAPGTEAATATYMVDTGQYNCKVHALKFPIADEVRSNTDMPLSADRDATTFLTLQGLLQKEKNFADNFLKTGVWTFSADGSSSRSATLDFKTNANNNLVYWSSATSTPIEDVKLMKQAVQKETGFRPNVMVVSRKVYDTLLDHPDIIDRLNRGQTTGTAMANRDDLMRLFELDDLVIMDAINATNAEGVTAAYNFINEKHGLLLYRPASPGLLVPSAGYTFMWRGYIGASSMGTRIKRYRVEANAADFIEIENAYTFEVIGADLAVWLNEIIA